jgi:hypothetical protein
MKWPTFCFRQGSGWPVDRTDVVHSRSSFASELHGGPSLPSVVPSTQSPIISVPNEKLSNDSIQQQLAAATLSAYSDARLQYRNHRLSVDPLPVQNLPDQASQIQLNVLNEQLNNRLQVEQSLGLLPSNSNLYSAVPAARLQSPILEKPIQQSTSSFSEPLKTCQSQDETMISYQQSVGGSDIRLQSPSVVAPPGGALKNRSASNSALRLPDSTTSGTKKCVTFNDNMVTEYSFSGSYGSTSSEGSCLPQSPADLTETLDTIQGGIPGIPSGHNETAAYAGLAGVSLLYGVQSSYPYRATGQPYSAAGNQGNLS